MAEFFVSYDLERASASRSVAMRIVFESLNAEKILRRTSGLAGHEREARR